MVNGWKTYGEGDIIWVRDGKYMWPMITGDAVIRAYFWPTAEAGGFEKEGTLFLPEEYLL